MNTFKQNRCFEKEFYLFSRIMSRYLIRIILKGLELLWVFFHSFDFFLFLKGGSLIRFEFFSLPEIIKITFAKLYLALFQPYLFKTHHK